MAKPGKAQAAPVSRNSVQAVKHSTLIDIEGYLQDYTALRKESSLRCLAVSDSQFTTKLINKSKILILSGVLYMNSAVGTNVRNTVISPVCIQLILS